MTKERVINTGIQLFSEKGYSNVGLAEILKESGIPKGSFYHHFKSKEAYAMAVIEKYSSNSLELFRAALLVHKDLPPRERIISFYEAKADDFERAGYKSGCLLGDSCSDGGISKEYKGFVEKHMNRWQMIIELCLMEAKEMGQLDDSADPRMLAAIILNGWEGALSRMKSSESRQPLDDFVGGLYLLL